jgi:hypothetical protein
MYPAQGKSIDHGLGMGVTTLITMFVIIMLDSHVEPLTRLCSDEAIVLWF